MDLSIFFKSIIFLVIFLPCISLPCICIKSTSEANDRRRKFEKELERERKKDDDALIAVS